MLEGCTSLTAATLVEGVTETPEGLFKGCISLSKVGLPSTLTRLGDYTFYECKALKNNEWTSIVMPGQTTTDDLSKEAGNLLEEDYSYKLSYLFFQFRHTNINRY